MTVATDTDPGSSEEDSKDEKALKTQDDPTDAVETAEEDEGPKRFVEMGPHVIQDTKTSIYWMKKDSWLDKGKYFNWHESKEYALTKNIRKIGGFDDWRLPSPDETFTIYSEEFENKDKGGITLHLDKTFPEGSFKAQWMTADTSTKRPRLDFSNGKVFQVDEYVFGAVRLCRREPVRRDDKRIRPARK